MPGAEKRLVKFVGGPCDGLECRDDSADHFESSIAIVWSLFRIGCGGPLDSPEILNRRRARRAAAPPNAEIHSGPAARYRVIRRALQRGTLVSIACHAAPEHN
jgi:hypothetical protein